MTPQQINNFKAANDYNSQFQTDDFIFLTIKNWRYFVVSLMVCISVAYLINKMTPPAYSTSGKIFIQENGERSIVFEDEIEPYKNLTKGQKIANDIIVLKSKPLAANALNRLSFDVEYYEDGFFFDKELYPADMLSTEIDWQVPQLTNGFFKIKWENDSLFKLDYLDDVYSIFDPKWGLSVPFSNFKTKAGVYRFGQWVELPVGRFKIDLIGRSNSGELLMRFRDLNDLITEYTGEKLEIETEDKLASIVTIKIESQNAFKSTDYINTLMDVFLEKELKEKNSLAIHTINFIDNQISGISDSLQFTQSTLQNFRTSNKTYDIISEGSTIFEKMTELEKYLSEEKLRIRYFKNFLENFNTVEVTELSSPSGIGIDDPTFNRLISELIQLNAQRTQLLTSQTEGSPFVIEVNKKILVSKASINDAVKGLIRKSNLTINDLQRRISENSFQFEKLPGTERDLLNIKRKNSINENLYSFLMQKRAQAAIILASNKPNNQIIERSSINLVPLSFKPLLIYLLSIFAGVIIPIIFISFLVFFDDAIRYANEVERILSIPILGRIGKSGKNNQELAGYTQPNNILSEGFRALRTNIYFTFPKDKKIVITVTSCVANEGKSFTASNLAAVFSKGCSKTLLINSDLRKRYNSNYFNLSNEIGLSSYLIDPRINIADILKSSNYPFLDIITPGPMPPNPAELLMSERLSSLIAEAKEIYDVIIMDSSPIVITNETRYLTTLDDITLVVVRVGYSRKEFLRHINDLSLKEGIQKLYVMLNDIPSNQMIDLKYR
jgi:capsular exopolysaccharide synthesis family protein